MATASLCPHLTCRGEPLLHRAREMRRDAKHPFDGHELPTMVHLVLLHAHDHLETRFGRRVSARRLIERLAEEAVREGRNPGSRLFAALPEEGDDIGF